MVPKAANHQTMNHLRHPAEAPRFVPLINDKVFKLVYVSAENIDRRINYVKDAEDKIKAEQLFSEIDIEENADFAEMETLLKKNNPDWIPHNLTGIFTFENRYSPEGAEKFG